MSLTNRHDPLRPFSDVISDKKSTKVKSAPVTFVAYYGQVTSNQDQNNSKLIQVRVEGIDDAIALDKDLPWCMSASPNFFYCLPQVDEFVFLFIMNPWNKNGKRVYFGPMQTGNFGEQPYSGVTGQYGLASFLGNK
jgi:hypothetical protein